MNSIKGVSPSISKNESPKTPGGISKSLLTPCRRVGLSRKWKKGGCSPFISPLSTQDSTPEIKDDRETRKRKKCEEIVQEKIETPQCSIVTEVPSVSTPRSDYNSNNDITTTPIRHTQISRKKSKALSRRNSQEGKTEEKANENQLIVECHVNNKEIIFNDKEQILSQKSCKGTKMIDIIEDNISKPIQENNLETVSKPMRAESKSKKLSLKKALSKNDCNEELKLVKHENSHLKPKEKSPNNLTKECIVVIQKKLFKVDNNIKENDKDVILQRSQESNSEPEIPLRVLNKERTDNVTLDILNDDDFISKPKDGLKKKVKNLSITRPNRTSLNIVETKASQSSQEGVEKRTILIKKSYDKVMKPSKAKSTGSITQEDIDELKERIEMKKKLLMAKSMSIDTDELRVLIRKWQKGCQDALMELLDLMKKKLPEQQNMDYAEMLQTLKIPPELVGYDSENDCFVTPDDTNVLLSAFKL